MKKIALFLFLLSMTGPVYCQSVVTIGTGTATQKQPFGMWASYERSASLYLSSEIGSFGSYGMMINSLAWNVGTGYQTMCPVKIYLKSTTSSNLSNITWASIINGATLVYDASSNFTSPGWRNIDIADFAYISGNLLVLCETNYGGSGATFYPVFKYSYSPNKHEFWQEYDSPPLGNGTINENRPNIQITYTNLPGSVVPPSGFMAKALTSSQINLNWKKNAANDGVLVAYNAVNTFGIPNGNYNPGENISGGGTVIYNGTGITFTQTTGLIPGTTYYYRAWSKHPPVPEYSIETGSMATTLCDIVSQFPDLTDFEAPSFPPSCWSLSGLPWLRSASASGYGAGSASAFADFFQTSAGEFEMISPELNFGSLSSVTISFDHAYATYSTQVDRLELLYSSDNGNSFTLLNTWLGGFSGPLNTAGARTTAFIPASGEWATKSNVLPSGTNKVKFRAVSGYGNNLFLDNISFQGECPSPTNLITSSITSSGTTLGWTPAGSPGVCQVIWGPTGFDTLTGGTLVPGITTSSYQLDGLEAGHAYEYYVRADCGSAMGAWEGPASWITPCDIAIVPYFENFDNYSPPETACNSVTDNNGDGIKWITSSLNPSSPPNSISLSQNNIMASNDWFFAPGINLSEGVTYTLNFRYRGAGSVLAEKLEIKYGTGPSETEMTSGQIWNDPDIQALSYIQGHVLFSPGTSGVYYIGWHGYSEPGTGSVDIDDVSVDEALITWNGSVSGDWEDPVNWTPSVIPNGFQNVTIPAGTLFMPAVSFGGLECRDLTISSETMLTLYPGSELLVNGNILIMENAIFDNQGMVILKGNLENQNPN